MLAWTVHEIQQHIITLKMCKYHMTIKAATLIRQNEDKNKEPLRCWVKGHTEINVFFCSTPSSGLFITGQSIHDVSQTVLRSQESQREH